MPEASLCHSSTASDIRKSGGSGGPPCRNSTSEPLPRGFLPVFTSFRCGGRGFLPRIFLTSCPKMTCCARSDGGAVRAIGTYKQHIPPRVLLLTDQLLAAPGGPNCFIASAQGSMSVRMPPTSLGLCQTNIGPPRSPILGKTN